MPHLFFAACWIPSCALCAMNPATGGTPTAWPGSRTGAKVCCPVLGIFFLLVFCLYLFAQVVLVSVSQAERLKNAALFMIGFLPRTLAAGAVLCIYWGVMLAWMPYTIPVVLILGFWLPCTLALQIIYPALDKAFHLEKTITARREDEINDLMEQHGHTSV